MSYKFLKFFDITTPELYNNILLSDISILIIGMTLFVIMETFTVYFMIKTYNREEKTFGEFMELNAGVILAWIMLFTITLMAISILKIITLLAAIIGIVLFIKYSIFKVFIQPPKKKTKRRAKK